MGKNGGGAVPEVSSRSPREPGRPASAEVPYCDLPRCRPAPEDPLSTLTSSCQSVVGPGRGPEPERWDWDTVERREEAPSGDNFTVMIPRKSQEVPRADSARKAPPLLTQSPVGGGDTTGQKKEGKLRRWEPKRRTALGQAPGRKRVLLLGAVRVRADPGLPRDTTERSSKCHLPGFLCPSLCPKKRCPGCFPTTRDLPSLLSPPNHPTGQCWNLIYSTGCPQDLFHTAEHPQSNFSFKSCPTRQPQNLVHPTGCPKDLFHTAGHPQSNLSFKSCPTRQPQNLIHPTGCPQDLFHTAGRPQNNLPLKSCPTRQPQNLVRPTGCLQDLFHTAEHPQSNLPLKSCPTRQPQNLDASKTSSTQRDTPRATSPSRVVPRDSPRTSSTQRNNPRVSSPPRAPQQDTSRASYTQEDNPQAPVPTCTPQRGNPRPCVPQNAPRSSSAQRDNPKTSCTQRDNPKSSSSRRENPGSTCQGCTQQDNPRASSPHRSSQWNNPRNTSPHRTNKDIPWASFPLRPTQSDGPRTSSPSRSKQSEVPWASIALRPTQSDRPRTSSPARPAQRDSHQSSGPTQHNSPFRATATSHNPGHHGASRTSSPLHPTPHGAPQTFSEPPQPPCAVCIGHRDAPRASSPPRYLQHDPFPFFPDLHASESESPHHDPPYMPPAVCIGHRDAPRASSPPRHTQFDPFPFLPDTLDAENQSPQHDPPQFPPPVCIGYRDAPRASSPPRHAPEPSLLFPDLPRASTESLVPSMDSLHEPPAIPTPVCIGHRDAPSFSSPPRQPPEPSLFFQDPPGTSMESLAPSTDSLRGSPVLPPQVCIGHRDAPRASSPPRHPPSDLALLAPSPPPGSSEGSWGSAPPGEIRHNLEREEYTVLADLPPARRLAQREPGPQGSNRGRTRSPGRAEEVRGTGGLPGPGRGAVAAAQPRSEPTSPKTVQPCPQQGGEHGQPAGGPLYPQGVTKPPTKQAEPARRSCTEAPHPRSPERRSEGDWWLQGSSPPPRTSARTPEREQRTQRPLERGQAGPRQPLGGWRSQEEPPGSRTPHRRLERGWCSQEEGPGLGGWQGPGESSRGAARAPEGMWRGPPRESEESWSLLGGLSGHRWQSETLEEPRHRLRRWEPKRRTALGQAPGRKRVLLLGAVRVRADPGLPRDTTERSSKCHLPGFLCPSLCPKKRCPGCFPTTRDLPSLLSPPNHPTGQCWNLIYSTGCPQDLFHTAEHPQSNFSFKSCPTRQPQNLVHPTGCPKDLFHTAGHPQSNLSFKSCPTRQPQNLIHPTGCPQDLFHTAGRPQNNLPLKSCPTRQPQNLVRPTGCLQDLFHTAEHPQSNLPLKSCPTRQPQNLDASKTSSTQRDTPRATSPSRVVPRDSPRTSSTQRNNPRVSSPPRAPQQDTSRASYTQEDNPQAPVPTCTPQRGNPRPCVPQNAPRSSSAQRDNPKTSCTQRDNPKSSSSRRENPGSTCQGCTQQDNPRASSPHRSSQWNNPRNTSPHRTNKDIPWASFPLRPTQSDGPRTSSPSRSKQSEVPWASIALRPTQSDRPRTSSPARPAQRDSHQSSGPTQHNSPFRATATSHNPGHHGASRTSSPLHPTPHGAPQTFSEPPQPPCAVCIGHRDAPRASSPPRYLQHDPFPFFPDLHASESESPHHDPPYMPPAVCIGHRDAPRASSPPRHTQFDPFPFLPDTLDAENQSPQHDPPQFPPPVCIGYRDAPRASSPPRHAPEPSLLFPDLPRASTESLVPSMDSLHEPPAIPTPVCIGHRDAPSFSSPPRQPPEPSLFFQDPPGTSMESLAPSTDSLRGSPVLPPQVCIGHRDAPRASSPPRHPPSDLALLAPSPPPGSSEGSWGSAPPGEIRHNLEREEYTVLADLPPARRLAQREPGPQGSNRGRTRSPGRAEEVRGTGGLPGPGRGAVAAAQPRSEPTSPKTVQPCPQQGGEHGQPAGGPLYPQGVTKPPTKQAEPARRSCTEAPHPRSPERRSEGDWWLQGSSPPPRTSARTPEREQRTQRPLERGQAGPRQPLGGWRSQEEPPGSRTPHRRLERGWCSQEEGPGLGGWQGPGESSRGAARAPEGMWRGPPRESEESWSLLGGLSGHRWQSETLEEPRHRSAQRGWGSLQELSSPRQPVSPPENSRAGPREFSKSQRPETSPDVGRGAEGACPHLHGPERRPELDWRDLVSLLGVPREGTWTRSEQVTCSPPVSSPTLTSRLPRLDWEGLLELLQAQLLQKDPARHWVGPGQAFPGTKGTLELEQDRQSQPEGGAGAALVNGYDPGQWPQSSAQPSSPASISTQWPKTKVSSGPESSATTGLEEGHLGSRSPAEGPSSPQRESKEPEESERSRGQDSVTDQKQADS
ncbi:TRIOBP, partial [Cervus elaphus hippelaphus]